MTKDLNTVTYIIDLRTSRGEYVSFEKTFNNKRHLDNWCRKMMQYGNKVVGEVEMLEAERTKCS